MTLRRQAQVITGVTLVVLIIVLYVVSFEIIDRQFVLLEESFLRRNVERALNAVAGSVAQVASVAGDWAYWDDTHMFLRGARPDYIEKNLQTNSLQTIRIGLFVCANTSGQIVVAKCIDLQKAEELPVPASVTQLLVSSGIIRQTDPTNSATGIINLPEAPMLVAAFPVLNSARQGPIAGTLVMGRFLDAHEIARVAEMIRLEVDLCPPGDTKTISVGSTQRGDIIGLDLTGRDVALGYGVVKDISGAPVFALRVHLPRDIHRQGRRMLDLFGLILMGVGLVFYGMITLLLERRVLAPLAGLAGNVVRLSTRRDPAARLAVSGDDELSALGRCINGMLDALQRRLRFQEIIGALSSDIARIDVDATDASISRTLAPIGRFTGTDRAYVVQYRPGTTIADNTHEWCAEGVPAQMATLQDIPMEEARPWFFERVSHHEFVRVGQVADLPHEARLEQAYWQSQGVKSLVVAPMFHGQTMTGFIGFDALRTPRTWMDDEEALLRIAGEAIVRAIERRRADVELRASETKHSMYVSHAPHGIVIFDGAGRFVDVNPAACRLTGYTRDDLLAMTVEHLLSSDTPQPYNDLLEELKRARAGRVELVVRRKTGTDIHIALDVVPLGEERLMGFCVDITGRKLAEAQLLRDSSFRDSIIDSAAEGICACQEISVHPFIQFTVWNKRMTQITGYTMDEINELGWYQSLYTDPDVRARAITRMSQMRKGDDLNGEEWEITCKDGQLRQILISTRAIHTGDIGTNVLAVMTDITERKRSELEKTRLQDQLLQAQKMESVGRLAGGVAHDFNNMLGVILGHAEMAMAKGAGAAPVLPHLQEIQKVAQRSADLTRQLLAFARKQAIVPMVVDLNETVEGMLNMLRRLIGEDVILDWLPGQGIWTVKIDPTQIDQVLANLCVNARDAIAGVGKITITTGNASLDETGPAGHPGFFPGDYVQLEVSDNGRGMEQEVLDHIFEPFFTTKDTGQGTGTGLGLATVYGIIKQHGGFVNVCSEPERGTVFTISLPRFSGEKEAVPPADRNASIPRGRGETILLVEDASSILDMGKAMLDGLGYLVLTAGTPHDALALVTSHDGPIDLILTDVIMPEMNGRALSEQIRAVKPGLKCLFMSGYTADIISNKGVLEEGIHFIQKPFSMKDLATSIRAALDQ